MRLKIILILIFSLYQTNLYSTANQKSEFNQKYLSNYFSALLSSGNNNDSDAIKYFEASKFLIDKHDNFIKKYIFSLVLDGQVKKAIKQVKIFKKKNNLDFFEGEILLILDSFKNKQYKELDKNFKKKAPYLETESYEFVIYEILKSYNNLFLNRKITKPSNNFGKLNLITDAFQNCYLNSNKARSYFLNIINSKEGDYSRYLFFYLGNIIQNKEYNSAKKISTTIEPLTSSLIISQAKNWIEVEEYKKFNNYFSCKNENDLLSEFFFLISNLYSSQDQFEKSNFYLNISNYLNPKFYFNLSLLVENYYLEKNYELAKQILKKFHNNDESYKWYKIKKTALILKKQKNDEHSLKHIEKEIIKLKNLSTKIIYDLANIYKNFKKYEKAIEHYTEVLSRLDNNTSAYADVLYRRGGSFERIGEYKKSDSDLLESLKIRSDDPYILNYLAYSWLERNYRIDEAIEMLNKAYKLRENDPYITDSVGWGYYLVGDYEIAEKYLRKAVELMPEDPIVNDHYGDLLWQLDRKLQAKYFWENVLRLEETDAKMKRDIKLKLLNGPIKLN